VNSRSTPREFGLQGFCMTRQRLAGWLVALMLALAAPAFAQTWTADNGNGTFTNPLFFDEFSDPDLIRVGKDFYLTGTTMHSLPGLRSRHSSGSCAST